MDAIDQLREFNHNWTRAFGLIGRDYLGSGLGMTEVRVLWQLGHAGPASARDIAQLLGLDEGQLSRILSAFETRGWLARTTDRDDARRRLLALTAEGQDRLDRLESQSRDDLGQRIGALGGPERTRLAEDLDKVRRLVAPLSLPELRDLAPGDAGWVIERHAVHYTRDEGYDASFEALVTKILADWLPVRDPARERAFILWAGGRRLGSVFCFREDEATARLRMFLVEPETRGTGLGRKMLHACLGWAASRGYRRLVLRTHESHRAAGALYASEGFELTETRATVSFGQAVVEQVWQIDLGTWRARNGGASVSGGIEASPLAITGLPA